MKVSKLNVIQIDLQKHYFCLTYLLYLNLIPQQNMSHIARLFAISVNEFVLSCKLKVRGTLINLNDHQIQSKQTLKTLSGISLHTVFM